MIVKLGFYRNQQVIRVAHADRKIGADLMLQFIIFLIQNDTLWPKYGCTGLFFSTISNSETFISQNAKPKIRLQGENEKTIDKIIVVMYNC